MIVHVHALYFILFSLCKTPKIVDFVVKRYEVREAKQIAVRSTQCQNRRVRNTHGRRGCHHHDCLYYYQNAYSKCRIYTASLQRARGALTTRSRRPRRPHSVPTARCLTHCANAKPRRLFWACSKQTPPHGVLGDCIARTQRCWWLHSAHLGDLHF